MPGFGRLAGRNGHGPSRQRLALMASAATLLAALLLVLALSPSGPRAPRPLDLLAYGDPGALAALRLRRGGEVGRAFSESQFQAELRAVGVRRSLEDLAVLLKPYVPPALYDLAPLTPKLLEMDLAAFVYPAASGSEIALVARAQEPQSVHLATERGEEYRGHALRVFVPAPGHEVHLAWRDELLFAATARERLRALIDRYEGQGASRLDQDPRFTSAVADLPPGDRALLYVDLSQALSREPWSAAASMLRRWLPGDPKSLALSADTRPGGLRLAAHLTVGPLSPWAAEVASLLGKAEPMGTPAVTPREILAFGGIRFSPQRLRERLRAGGGPLPGWLAPLERLLAATWSPAEVDRALGNSAGEAALGLLPSRPFASLYVAGSVVSPEIAAATLAAIGEGRPSPGDDDLGLHPRREDKTVDGVRLTTRAHELLPTRARGYGLYRGWLFGGDLPAAEGLAKALAGTRWKPSALAREVFSQPAQILGWVDGAAVLQALRRAAVFEPGIGAELRELGRLPESLLDAGGVLRVESNRICAQAFVRYRDL